MKISIKRRAFTLLELLIVLALVGMLAALLWPIFVHRKAIAFRNSCQSNLKQLGLGFMQYSRDYDEKFPPLVLTNFPGRGAYGWAEATQPYIKSTLILNCPTYTFRPHSNDPTQRGFTDYWMNTRVGGSKMSNHLTPRQTFLCGEGNDGSDISDARYNRPSVPQHWFDGEGSPARRHLDGANYLFADGHVEWLPYSTLADDKRAGRNRFRL